MDPLIDAIALEQVVFRHGERAVLDGLSLSVRPGELVALLGRSGSGKTSVLRLVLGFAAPARGAVRLDGETVSVDGRILRPPEERGVAMVFQDLALWPHLTVAGNLDFGLASRGIPRPARADRIQQMLARVGLEDRAFRYPGELSGGERQRVALARALVLEPRAVLLDEPLSSLDAPLKRELIALLAGLLEERKVSGIYVTHDVREAVALGDRIAVLQEGRIAQEGTLDGMRAAPATDLVRELLQDTP